MESFFERIMEVLKEGRPMTLEALSRKVGARRPWLSGYMTRLYETGTVSRIKIGRAHVYMNKR